VCLTCACDLPFQDHGDSRNLTYADLAAAAEAAGIGVDAAAANLASALDDVHAAGDAAAVFTSAAGLGDDT
jgi:hypothetical protein